MTERLQFRFALLESKILEFLTYFFFNLLRFSFVLIFAQSKMFNYFFHLCGGSISTVTNQIARFRSVGYFVAFTYARLATAGPIRHRNFLYAFFVRSEIRFLVCLFYARFSKRLRFFHTKVCQRSAIKNCERCENFSKLYLICAGLKIFCENIRGPKLFSIKEKKQTKKLRGHERKTNKR